VQTDEAKSAGDKLKKRAAAERKELNRLKKIYKALPPDKFSLALGLIQQAARLKVQLDELSEDIAANGLTEMFQQSDKVPPYERERPAVAMFAKLDKNYQAAIDKLGDMMPTVAETPETVHDAFDCD